MSAPQSFSRAVASSSKTTLQQTRFISSSSASSSTPPLRAALLLSRPPLLTSTPASLETSYQAYQSRIRQSLSNPINIPFYFKPGSLPLRRFQKSQHTIEVDYFGKELVGKEPDVGEIPAENQPTILKRDYWVEKDSTRGEKSLERAPEESIYCLLKGSQGGDKGKWIFPSVEVNRGEGLDEAIKRGLIGVDGELGGNGMDSWLVTRKPIGMVKTDEIRTFFLHAQILAGEPSPSSKELTWAWLTSSEIKRRFEQQGDQILWGAIRGMFGISGPTDI